MNMLNRINKETQSASFSVLFTGLLPTVTDPDEERRVAAAVTHRMDVSEIRHYF
jgi:hypothetical protein